MVQHSHLYMTTGKTIALTIRTFVGKVIGFNMLSRFVIVFLPWSKRLLISGLQSPSTVILEPKKKKFVTASTFSHSICHKEMGLDTMNFIFWMLSFKPAFSLSSFTLIRWLLVPLYFLPLEWYHRHTRGCWYVYQGCSFSRFSPTIVIFCLFDYSHASGCKMFSHCAFDLHFLFDKVLNIYWCIYLEIQLFKLYILFGETSFPNF